MTSNRGRTSYLLDGRRVAVHDLLEANLVAPGESLRFTRPRSGHNHKAVIEPDGSLLVDGRRHGSPSAAARAAVGSGQLDGWTAWTTTIGKTLHELRAELLETIARETAAAPNEDMGGAGEHRSEQRDTSGAGHGEYYDEDRTALLPRHEFLRRAREAAEHGDPERTTVRGLLRKWSARSRGSQISRHIEADLDNHGLRTDPDFLSVTLDDEVDLVALRPGPDPSPGGDIAETAPADPASAGAASAAIAEDDPARDLKSI